MPANGRWDLTWLLKGKKNVMTFVILSYKLAKNREIKNYKE